MGSSLSFFTFMYLSFLLFSFQLTSSRQPLCHDKEHSALLRFKESFFIHHEYYYSDSACSKKTELWNLKGNGDCCSWEGVKCNVDTGYVIKLDLSSSCLYGSINSSSTLFHLVHLQWLSLAYNNFNDSKIPSGIMNLSRLSHLNLSHSYFSGQIPPEMLELSNLESLDLSRFWSFERYELQLQQPGYGLQLQQPNLKSLVEKLTNLKVLDLSSVNNISSSQLEVLTNLSSLKFLSLQNCNLEGTIPSSLGNLSNLIHLVLSDNNFGGTIPSSIVSLTKLVYLDISFNNLQGQIQSEMLELSQLEYLDLSYNYDLQLGGLRSLVDKLTNLKWLDLSSVNISSPLLNSLGNLSSLTHLSLRNCMLQGTIPSSLGNLYNLIHLDLFSNNFEGQIPSEMLELSQLEYLDLSYNWYPSLEKTLQLRQPGGLRSLVDKLTNLKWLDLTDVNISSSIPDSLGNLSSLTYLSLDNCKLQGTIPSSIGSLTKLVYLDISYNYYLQGTIPSSIGSLTKLNTLTLSSNNLQGTIPSSIGSLTKLVYLDFVGNNLQGTIPSSIGSLTKLVNLDISDNNLQGTIPSSIGSLTKLVYLDFVGNNLQGTIPSSIGNLTQLESLDLSSNNLSGQIPGWFLNITENSLERLNLSHNLLTGFEQRPDVLSWTNLEYLDLSFNRLQGPLPISPISTIQLYLVSNNNLSGELSPWICKLNSLYALDLSNNNLSGKLPQCLGNFSYQLSMLNLQNNKFCGSIPQTFMNGTWLRMIDLSDNMLEGKIPRSLANCTMLEFLDLGNNKINDTFPSWIGNLPNLVVLNLQSNKLYGAIEEPKSDFEFPKLQIIDLSHNRFTGKLPSHYFACWNAMKVVNESQLAYMMKSTSDGYLYDYSLRMVNKGIEIEYEKISNMLMSICLSDNRFEGEIPASISILHGLRYLNLSNNNLVGGIPSSLDNLTVLESLDLSNNNLSGEIPPQLVKLTPLAFFNVSFNNFTGPIPHGAQFDTFNNRSYEGNPRLCGQPLSKECEHFEPPKKEDEDFAESPFVFDWKLGLIGFSSGLIVGVVLGQEFYTRKHEWFVKTFGIQIMKRKRGRRN